MSASAALLEIDGLSVSTRAYAGHQPVEILHDVSLTIRHGEVHALAGPSSSGKSTLAASLMGAANTQVTSGTIRFNGDDITDWDTDIRAKAGLFLAFQHPQDVAGVTILNVLQQARSARTGTDLSVRELRLAVLDWMTRLAINDSYLTRFLNDGFTADERARHEVLQMAILGPEMAILDETDAGLDADTLRVVAMGLQAVRKERPQLGTLAITHTLRLLNHLAPDAIHILIDGRIVASGGPDLTLQLETDGYDSFR